MLTPISLRCLRVLRKSIAHAIALCVCFAFIWSAQAGLESGTYQTIFGATALEAGDYVTNGSRIVPLTATLTLDLAGAQPALTAVIHDAVLEGGSAYGDLALGGRPQPFELTVHSSTGSLLADGSYHFTGDYLQDLFPGGTQYLFDWQISPTAGSAPVWSGQMVWAGGHLWSETIPNTTLVPEPGLPALMFTGLGIFCAHHHRRKSRRNTAANSGC